MLHDKSKDEMMMVDGDEMMMMVDEDEMRGKH